MGKSLHAELRAARRCVDAPARRVAPGQGPRGGRRDVRRTGTAADRSAATPIRVTDAPRDHRLSAGVDHEVWDAPAFCTALTPGHGGPRRR